MQEVNGRIGGRNMGHTANKGKGTDSDTKVGPDHREEKKTSSQKHVAIG